LLAAKKQHVEQQERLKAVHQRAQKAKQANEALAEINIEKEMMILKMKEELVRRQ